MGYIFKKVAAYGQFVLVTLNVAFKYHEFEYAWQTHSLFSRLTFFAFINCIACMDSWSLCIREIARIMFTYVNIRPFLFLFSVLFFF